MDKDKFAKIMEQLDEVFDGEENPRAFHAAKARIGRYLDGMAAAKMGDREQHLTWTIANHAYQLILEENVSAKDALIRSASKYTEQVDEVLAEKSRNTKGMNRS